MSNTFLAQLSTTLIETAPLLTASSPWGFWKNSRQWLHRAQWNVLLPIPILRLKLLQPLCLDGNPYVACRSLQTINIIDTARKALPATKVVVLGRTVKAANPNKFRRFIQTLTNIARVS